MVETQVRKLRLEKGLSQEQLAEKAKVSVRTIQRLESGQDVSIETLNLVAGALSVEVKDLFTDQKTKKEEEKISHSNNQLQYQLEKRREEFQTIIKFYKSVYVLIMFSSVMLVTKDIWAGININGMFAAFWIFGWMIMNPLQKLIVMTILDPKLDEKYPLTMSRLDKDQEIEHRL